MNKVAIAFMLLACAKVGNGQSISTLMGARAAGMGFASSGLADVWSLFNNPGALGTQSTLSAAAAYEVRMQLSNANRMAFAVNVPMRWGVASLGVFKFGDHLYSEQLISGGYGNKFGIASLGIKVNYIQYRAEGFQTMGSVSLDFGGLVELSEQFYVGAYIFNINQAKINSDGSSENLPTRLTAGITYKPTTSILITTELDKDIDYKPIWRTGMEYSFREKFYARTGFNLYPQSGFVGMGARRKKLQADYAVQFNAITGISHQASATYSILENKKK
ncbi:MAG: hypothetical protein JNJ65_07520 [Cyclobacteriaceae bacterium]|nr:hypothetical protein [Cyclobacteriaceae bacterium]